MAFVSIFLTVNLVLHFLYVFCVLFYKFQLIIFLLSFVAYYSVWVVCFVIYIDPGQMKEIGLPRGKIVGGGERMG